MFTHSYTVRLSDTDASGLLYFASQLRIAHEAFEAFLAASGISLSQILATAEYLYPIVHAEADYRAPARVGDRLSVGITAPRVGDTSFELFYRLVNDAGREVGTARTVHVSVDARRFAKCPLPHPLREKIQSLQTAG